MFCLTSTRLCFCETLQGLPNRDVFLKVPAAGDSGLKSKSILGWQPLVAKLWQFKVRRGATQARRQKLLKNIVINVEGDSVSRLRARE